MSLHDLLLTNYSEKSDFVIDSNYTARYFLDHVNVRDDYKELYELIKYWTREYRRIEWGDDAERHKVFYTPCRYMVYYGRELPSCAVPSILMVESLHRNRKSTVIIALRGKDGRVNALESAPLLQKKKDGLCPTCGENGSFRGTALACSKHGVYAGI